MWTLIVSRKYLAHTMAGRDRVGALVPETGSRAWYEVLRLESGVPKDAWVIRRTIGHQAMAGREPALLGPA